MQITKSTVEHLVKNEHVINFNVTPLTTEHLAKEPIRSCYSYFLT